MTAQDRSGTWNAKWEGTERKSRKKRIRKRESERTYK